jgi:membrane protein YqaA with SNARE-associated domain
MLKRLYDWILHWASTPYGVPALFAMSFAESSFFPVPPDVLLMALALGRPKRSLYYAFICSIASVLGGVLGYFIGAALWDIVSAYFFSYIPGFTPERFGAVQALFEKYNFWIVFFAGFTPIPYKVFTIGAGVFHIAFAPFFAASLVGRSLRFFAVGGLIYCFGAPVRSFIDRYLNWLAWALMILLLAGFWLIKVVM